MSRGFEDLGSELPAGTFSEKSSSDTIAIFQNEHSMTPQDLSTAYEHLRARKHLSKQEIEAIYGEMGNAQPQSQGVSFSGNMRNLGYILSKGTDPETYSTIAQLLEREAEHLLAHYVGPLDAENQSEADKKAASYYRRIPPLSATEGIEGLP